MLLRVSLKAFRRSPVGRLVRNHSGNLGRVCKRSVRRSTVVEPSAIGNLCPPRPVEVHGADATVGGPAAELGQQGGRDWVVARVPAITELPGEETGVGDPRPE